LIQRRRCYCNIVDCSSLAEEAQSKAKRVEKLLRQPRRDSLDAAKALPALEEFMLPDNDPQLLDLKDKSAWTTGDAALTLERIK